MHKFYIKNFMLATGLVMLSFAILGSLFIGFGRIYMQSEKKDSLRVNVAELEHFISSFPEETIIDDWNFRIVMSAIAQSTGNHCFVCDEAGTVTACSDPDFACIHIGMKIAPEILQSVSKTEDYLVVSTLNGFYPSRHYVAAMELTTSNGALEGYVFAASDSSKSLAVWHALMDIFLLLAIVIMILAMVLSFIASKYQARPINEMASASAKFAHGDFSARVNVYGNDEIGALSDSFNKMAESLEKSEMRRSEFIANIAHELKTPMTIISGFADGILDGTIPPENQKKYLETVSSETKRLNRLVHRMLDASRLQDEGIESLLKKSFVAGDLLLETLIVFEKSINDKNLQVNTLIPEDDIIVLGDHDAITQVVYNLLDNAVKFATVGSELGVSLFRLDDKAYISIKNEGETIAPDELALVFDRFHKTDKSRSMDRDGVGLGLYIVKEILGNHGEDIAVTSQNGITEFVFSLTIKKK